jgi:small subunit ribosomal protein S6
MEKLTKKIQNFITNNGGEIKKIEEWGKKRLAYEINRKQYGTYFHILFDGPSSLPGLLEREYRLEDSILRYLTIKTDPKALLVKKEKQAVPEASTEPSQPEEPAEVALEIEGSEDVEDIAVVDEPHQDEEETSPEEEKAPDAAE